MHSRRVLIVDDQVDVRRVLRAGLEMLGREIKITDVPSAEEALLVLTRQPVDLLITDIYLAGISGLELKDRARKRSPELRLILITGMSDEEMRQKVVDAGADAYFFKPIDMSAFLDTAQQLLGIKAPPPALKTRLEQAAEVPPRPQPVPAAEPGQLPRQRLTDLQRETGAICAALLDDQGRLLERAGDPGLDCGAAELMSSLPSIYTSVARFSALLGPGAPQDFISLLGPSSVYFLTHVGYAVTLLVVLPTAAWDPERQAKLQRSTRMAVLDLRQARPDWTLPPPEVDVETPAPLAEPPGQEPESQPPLNLEQIFGQAQPGLHKAEDLDAFWEAALDEPESKTAAADGISYEQARQMGLAPKDD
jgi:CheY-like chemotaxis protein